MGAINEDKPKAKVTATITPSEIMSVEMHTILIPIARQLEKMLVSNQWQKIQIDTRPITNGVAMQISFTIEDKIVIAKTLPFKEPTGG